MFSFVHTGVELGLYLAPLIIMVFWMILISGAMGDCFCLVSYKYIGVEIGLYLAFASNHGVLVWSRQETSMVPERGPDPRRRVPALKVKVIIMALLLCRVAGNDDCKENCLRLNAHCPTLEGDGWPGGYGPSMAHIPEDDCFHSVRTCLYSCNNWRNCAWFGHDLGSVVIECAGFGYFVDNSGPVYRQRLVDIS